MTKRFVLDTNVIVSAILVKQSVSRKSLDRASAEGIILQSPASIYELYDVLRRKKFDKYIPEEDRLNFLLELIKQSEIVHPTTVITDCRDAKDNKFLELAVDGHADLILSNDEDLLILNPFREIFITPPHLFVIS